MSLFGGAAIVGLFFAAWFGCGVMAAVAALRRGDSGCGWLLVGLMLGPVGLVLSLTARPDPAVVEARRLASGELVICPSCGEAVRRGALKCRFCGVSAEEFAGPADREHLIAAGGAVPPPLPSVPPPLPGAVSPPPVLIPRTSTPSPSWGRGPGRAGVWFFAVSALARVAAVGWFLVRFVAFRMTGVAVFAVVFLVLYLRLPGPVEPAPVPVMPVGSSVVSSPVSGCDLADAAAVRALALCFGGLAAASPDDARTPWTTFESCAFRDSDETERRLAGAGYADPRAEVFGRIADLLNRWDAARAAGGGDAEWRALTAFIAGAAERLDRRSDALTAAC